MLKTIFLCGKVLKEKIRKQSCHEEGKNRASKVDEKHAENSSEDISEFRQQTACLKTTSSTNKIQNCTSYMPAVNNCRLEVKTMLTWVCAI